MFEALNLIHGMETRLTTQIADIAVDVSALLSVPAQTHQEVRAQFGTGKSDLGTFQTCIWIYCTSV